MIFSNFNKIFQSKTIRIFIIVAISIFFVKNTLSQEIRILKPENQIDSIILLIRQLQTKQDSFYFKGLFPSQRISLGTKKLVEDNNIFFSANILYILLQYRNIISEYSKSIIDSISLEINNLYPLYQNKNGIPIYNFWPQKPGSHFPNSRFFSKYSKFALPCDFDDTSLINLTINSDKNTQDSIKKLMLFYVNSDKIRNSFKKYRNFQTYPVWFGKKMPPSLDICVLCNTLTWVFTNNLTLNISDSIAIEVVKDIVLSGKYTKNSEIASPHYKKQEIIIYHIVRMICSAQLFDFKEVKKQLIIDINHLIEENINNNYYKLLLYNCLYKLGDYPENKFLERPIDTKFYFFVANMISTLPNPLYKWLNRDNNFCFKYYCEAFNLSLWLEYIILSNK